MLAKFINPMNADIVVFTGDGINWTDTIPKLQDTLKGLDAKIAKFAVRGNWDSYLGAGQDIFKDTGFTELPLTIREVEKDGESIHILGVNWDKMDEIGTLSPLSTNTFNIILCHTPDLVEYVDGLNLDLYLCGHTHGGQVALPGYGALVTMSAFGKKYESGMHQYKDIQIYTNRGIGMEGSMGPTRIRFGAPPEITVFEIVPKKQN